MRRALLSVARVSRLSVVTNPYSASLLCAARALATATSSALPSIVDVTDERVLSACLQSSASAPLVLSLLVANDAACEASLSTVANALRSPSNAGVRLALVDANELPSVVHQLRVTSVPAFYLFVRSKLVESLTGPGAGDASQLTAFIARAAAHKASLSPASAESVGDTKELLGQGRKALEEALRLPLSDKASAALAKTAAEHYAAVLELKQLDAPTRVTALAGLARAAALGEPRDLVTAAELLKGAEEAHSSVAPPASGAASPASPDIVSASALLSLLNEASATASVPPPVDGPEALHAQALASFQAGYSDAALEKAFLLVRKHREWREQAGRGLAIRLCDAMLPGDERAVKARRRLSALWFV
jgi:thioredoxin-like negative regulator of GroEL